METNDLYSYRLNQVVDYIQENLSKPIDLSILSAIAGFSPYHFHRIFSAFYRETPREMVNRLRLETAANLLIKNPKMSLTEISIKCGFSSSSVFSRSFKTHFELSPIDYRKTNLPIGFRSEKSPIYGYPMDYERWMPVLQNVVIKDLPQTEVAYTASYGYSPGLISQAWQKIYLWALAQELITTETVYLGISFDDPFITDPQKWRYYACISIPGAVICPEGIYPLTVQGGKYAVFRVACLQKQIHEVYMSIYRVWLPNSGYLPGELPPYDRYYSQTSDPDVTMEMDICIPIEKG